jgi:hypothetical protein
MSLYNKKFDLSPRLKFGVGRGHTQNQILKSAAIACLAIACVLSLNAGRLLLQNKNQAKSLAADPQVLGASDNKNLTTQENIQFASYTVQKGDTLFNISQKFNISWTTLATLNNLKSPFYLKPGQIIKVPK